jgi:uncharacterized membrane protein
MNEQRIHEVFQASILLKGAYALIECMSGVLLALISTDTIFNAVNWLTHGELSRDPDDFIANHLLNWALNLSVGTKQFYAFYLMVHGAVKILVVLGLLRGKLWSYPVALVVIGLFIAYQIYRYSITHGVGFIVLSVFDLFVIVLVWHEYRLARRHLPAT